MDVVTPTTLSLILSGVSKLIRKAKQYSLDREAKALIDEIQNQVASVSEELLVLQQREEGMSNEIARLERKIEELEDWDAVSEPYELQAVQGSAFVYGLKNSVQTSDPPHWLCCRCFERREKSILQALEFMSRKWGCPSCGSEVLLRSAASPESCKRNEGKRPDHQTDSPDENCQKGGWRPVPGVR